MEQFQFREEKGKNEMTSGQTGNAMVFQNAGKKPDRQEYLRKLKRPRSKKRMKVLEHIDVLSMTDKEVIAKMQEDAKGTLDASSVTQEDIEAYLAGIREEFQAMLQRDLEEERQRKEAEEQARREEEEERYNNTIQYSLGKCYISGCIVHSITHDAIEHYKRSQIPDRLANVYDFFKSVAHCEVVEVYPQVMVAVSENGEVLKTKEI